MSYRSNVEGALDSIEKDVENIKYGLVNVLDLITDLESLISEDSYDADLESSLVWQVKDGVNALLDDATRLGKEVY